MSLTAPLIAYHIAGQPPSTPLGQLMTYRVAGNGIFVHAQRPEWTAQLPYTSTGISGLPHLESSFTFHLPRVPMAILERILHEAYEAIPHERLWYLRYTGRTWICEAPPQRATPYSVQPTAQYDPHAYAQVHLEIHSHHDMPAVFSAQDNADETGCRLYAVLGTLTSIPTLHTRVGAWGHFCSLASSSIWTLPSSITDHLYPQEPR